MRLLVSYGCNYGSLIDNTIPAIELKKVAKFWQRRL